MGLGICCLFLLIVASVKLPMSDLGISLRRFIIIEMKGGFFFAVFGISALWYLQESESMAGESRCGIFDQTY